MPNYNAIQLNRIKLDACPRHKFTDKFEDVFPNGKIACVVCGGEMDLTYVSEYIRGYIAGGGNSNDIWDEFLDEDKEIKTKCPKCLGKGDTDCNLCNNNVYVDIKKVWEFLEISD